MEERQHDATTGVLLTNRREFVRLTGAGLLGSVWAPAHAHRGAAHPVPPAAPLRLLILGGTGFIGPHQVRYAVDRGHTVTVFTRGRREADLPDAVEHLIGDRNDELSALEGRTWDVVIDNPTVLPGWVRQSGRLLTDACRQYVFISAISVYADTRRPGTDESAPLLRYDGERDPFTLSIDEAGEYYGALKALSEREAAFWFPGRVTIVRPGILMGPGDESDRATYWPVRLARGGSVLAPGGPDDPLQIIDARDLAEWTVRLAEQGVTGTFNATGPAVPQTIGTTLARMIEGLNADAQLTWVDSAFLQEQNVRPWSELPLWIPPEPMFRGFMQLSVEQAIARGLAYRTIAVTARDTVASYRSRPLQPSTGLRAGLDPAREAELLTSWRRQR